MRELAVPQMEQQTGHTCGPVALASVLRYLGSDATEAELVELSGCTSAGTAPEGLRTAALYKSVVPHIVERMDVTSLRALVSAGHPVIVLLQAWPEAGKPRRWRERWDDGHYVVCTCVRKGSAVFMDPSLPGARGVLRLRDLEDRWHDRDVLGPGPARELYGLGIVFPPAGETARWQTLGRTKRIH